MSKEKLRHMSNKVKRLAARSDGELTLLNAKLNLTCTRLARKLSRLEKLDLAKTDWVFA